MEYAKDEIFNIRYNEYANRLEIGGEKKKGIRNFIKQHKFMSGVIAMTIVTMAVDGMLIYEFFFLLSTLQKEGKHGNHDSEKQQDFVEE